MTDKHIQNTQAVYEQYLILRIQTGETAALNDLVERWQGKFVRVAWIMCRDQQLALDAVQEAWIAIVKSLPGLEIQHDSDHGHDCVRHLIYILCFGDMHHLHLVMDLNE